jgi:hypothetical protein
MEPGDEGDVLAYSRTTGDQVILIVLNLARGPVTWRLPEVAGQTGWRRLLGTVGQVDAHATHAVGTAIDLASDEALILEGRP